MVKKKYLVLMWLFFILGAKIYCAPTEDVAYVNHTACKLDIVDQQRDEFDVDMDEYDALCSEELRAKESFYKGMLERLGLRIGNICFIACAYVLNTYDAFKQFTNKKLLKLKAWY